MGPLGEAELELGKSGTKTPQKGISERLCHFQMAMASPHLYRDASQTTRSQLQIGKLRRSTALPGDHIQSLLQWLLFPPGPVKLTFTTRERQHTTKRCQWWESNLVCGRMEDPYVRSSVPLKNGCYVNHMLVTPLEGRFSAKPRSQK